MNDKLRCFGNNHKNRKDRLGASCFKCDETLFRDILVLFPEANVTFTPKNSGRKDICSIATPFPTPMLRPCSEY